MEEKLQTIWAHVLNLPHVTLDQSFLAVGGDSISAMQVVGQCRKDGIGLGVQDVLRSRSIPQLALAVTEIEQISYESVEYFDEEFDLTPIQSLYFQRPNEGRGHFNQSFYLQIKQSTTTDDFHAAVQQLVSRHSMLRARFSFSPDNGWQQRLTNDLSGSYRFRYRSVTSKDEIDAMIEDSQHCLNHESGPLFAADFFDFGNEQFAFLTAHHIVIDLVSWRLLLEELEEILRGKELLPPALPFQKWAEMQVEHAEGLMADEVLPPIEVPALDFEYWGIQREDNTYGNATHDLFELEPEMTSLFLTTCHNAYNTEPVEVLLAALLQSWAHVFKNRSVPAIFNEGHGREPWDSEIDISRTVGWFTALSPILVAPSGDLTETVRKVKDFKRQIPQNGRPYFARRCLTADGHEQYKTHWPMEILFNYLGQYQQLERADALLQPIDTMAGEYRAAGGTSDFGHITPRWAIFEISAIVFKGHLKFAFTFNRHMRNQDLIQSWISECRATLTEMISELASREPMPTLSDFPLLALTETRFQSMLVSLKNIDVAPENIEDLYPCSNMQEGLLLSQNKDSGFYAAATLHELRSAHGRPTPEIVNQAWHKIVQRHPALRTIFIENYGTKEGLYSQVVLKQVEPKIVHMACKDQSDAVNSIKQQRSVSYAEGLCPNHRFTICTTEDGRLFCSLDISHAIMDGHSMSLLASELELACDEALNGDGAPYSNYISWILQQPQESSLLFWKSYLKGSEVCSFPSLDDGKALEKQLVSIRMDMDSFNMPDLQSFCNVNGITPSNIFHTAWAMTLSCYVGSNDVTFGYLTSARDSQDIHRAYDIVGPMINTLVCRVDLSEHSRSLLDVVQDVQKDYLEALPHRHIALADVQHILDLGGANLFNTALSYRRLPPDAPKDAPGVQATEICPIYDPTEYPISVNVEIGDSSVAVDLDYWTDYISAGQAANVASTFVQALENIIYNSSSRIFDLDHISSQHLQQIESWNQMPRTLNECVHHRIASWVVKQPQAPAIRSFDGDYTYAELGEVTNRLAHRLVDLGVKPETFVPTCFDKSSFAIVAMLSVLKAGGAAVPLDAKHPRPALQTRVEDSGAKVVLTTAARAEKFEGLVEHTIVVDRNLLDSLPVASQSPDTSVQPSNPCFVIFTSGSTGRPKGVVLEHSAIVTSAEAHGSKLGIGPQTRCLQFASYTFDNSLEEMFTSLQRGACVCVPSEEQRVNDLPGAIAELNANFMDLTPTVAALLKPSDVPSIKDLGLGAEPLTKALIEMWRPHVRLHGQYGPSEASINSAWRDFTNGGEATNIGRAIGSISYVINPDNRDRLMPIGCKGELLIEGPILSRGYLNDPEKTAMAFIKDPEWARSSGKTGRRFYCTGDLVQYTSEGEMIYMGRKDSQVKLNGQRIELGEIEHHLKLNLPTGAKSAVELVKFADSNSTKALVGFICLDVASSVTPAITEMTGDLRSIAKHVEVELGNALPAYYVPAMFMPVTNMPMTTSGKLDRKVLRQIAAAVPEAELASFRLAGNSGRPPAGHAEITLAKLWTEVLKLSADSVGADDSFFRLGGDSISAMRLVTAGRKGGIVLNVANVFAHPKLADMAATAEIMSSDGEVSAEVDTKPFDLLPAEKRSRIIEFAARECRVTQDSIEDIYPCTRLQEGLIALSAKDPGTYVAQPTYQLPSSIDIARFREAWNKVIAHESVLRTRVIHNDEFGFVQVVVDTQAEWVSLTSVEDLTEAHRQLPATPGGPLVSYIIVGEGTTSPLFIWTAHHAVYDGWSWSTLFNQVEACYRDLSAALPASVPFSRFVKYLSSLEPGESDRFWISHLENITAPQFPQLPGADYKVQATSQLLRHISISRHYDLEVTLPSVIRAAWGLLLATYSGSDDVLWGETNSGREAPVQDIEDIVGPTLTTAPVRLQLKRELTVQEYLKETQRQASVTLPYQFAGLQHIRKLSSETAAACDFQSFLGIVAGDNLQDIESDLWSMKSTGTLGTNFFSYALVCNCTVGKGGLSIEVLYDGEVTATWYIESLMRQFESLINIFTSSGSLNTLLSELDLLNPADISKILAWNKEPVSTIDRCIHDVVVEDSTSVRPDAIAIDAWDTGSMSYRELDERSSQLASRLISMGVKPRSFIPLCFDKSGWTIVAILAVLKAGAAFVPLDFEAPTMRLRELVEGVNAEWLLCAPKYEERFRYLGCKTLVIDRDATENRQGTLAPLPTVQSDSPAYAFYTSGSTGKPKGALINHNCFVSSSASFAPIWGISSSSRVLQFASYVFDACLIEILSTLMCGGTICVPDQDTRTNDLVGVINSFRVDWAALTPTVVRMMQPSQVPNLKTLVLVGEAMSQQDLTTWADRVTLGNGYGPTECSVVSTFNVMDVRTKPNNLGKAVTSRGWIVSRNDHNILVPIGAVGELLLEGPAVGAGYLNEPEKTAQAFVREVKWTSQIPDMKFSRFYKTGDLVKYNEDGTMLFLGRKDSQAKVRGQRLELSEVEHHLMEDQLVQSALAAVPNNGPCSKRLVGIVTLKDAATCGGNETITLLSLETASLNVGLIRDHLCERLPSYMIPSLWVAIEQFPLTSGGKMDRRRVTQWLESMDLDTYRAISSIGLEASTEKANTTERTLQSIFAKVLNLQVEDIRLNQSFLHLGGDSIAAMQVASQCRTAGFSISVQELIRAKSIAALAAAVSSSGDSDSSAVEAQETYVPFELSPIQRIFFETVGSEHNHFNQAELFNLTRSYELDEIKNALVSLVGTHPMLRARFKCDESGVWRQQIEKNSHTAFRLNLHSVRTCDDATFRPIINASQSSLNVSSGPVFTVDVFDIQDTFSQAISLVAHHLVVDVVSWGIILEDFQGLLGGVTPPPQSLPFHAWLQQQSTQARNESATKIYPVQSVQPADIGYWGVADERNLHADVLEQDIALSTRDTMLLLGAQDALGMETLDILVAALLESFRKTFADRAPITVHNEGHGREPFNNKQDLTRTVGWFTTLTPINLPVAMDQSTDIVSTIQWVKDVRDRTPAKGRPYFAYKQLTAEGQARFASHWPAELVFNYHGRLQHLDRKDARLQPLEGIDTTEVGANVPRFALFDVTAAINQGAIKMSFGYNRHMKYQSKIQSWIAECRQTLVDAVDQLLHVQPERSLSDFNLLPLAYKGMSRLARLLPNGTTIADIEDVYPTSPMQQGLLLTQMKNPELYLYHTILELRTSHLAQPVEPRRVAEAWQVVVSRHPALRTVFIDSLAKNGSKDQVVFKNKPGRVQFTTENDDNVASMLRNRPGIDCRDPIPPHQLTICKTNSGRVWIKLELSHAINDGTSIANILNDLSRAYKRKLTRADAGPLYRDFIAHLLGSAKDMDIAYWKNYLSGIEPCFFPTLNDGKSGPRDHRSLEVNIEDATIFHEFCKHHAVTLSNVLQLSWALVLHSYVGASDVSFGIVASGRDVPVKNVEEAVGVFVNMLIARFTLSDETTIFQLLQKLQEDSVNALSHQNCSLADIQNELQVASLFNSAFTFQRRSISYESEETALNYENMEAEDYGEYAVTINADVTDELISVDFGYWADKICQTQAQNFADTFERILRIIVSSDINKATVGSMDIFTAGSQLQVMKWNANLPTTIARCVHEVIHEQATLRPRTTKAIEGHDGSFTYQEFDKITDQLATYLQSIGVGTETFVPILFEKSSWAIISMIAIMKAGGAYVPLDPKHPQSRLQELITDVGAKVVLCSRAHQPRAAEVAAAPIIVDAQAMRKLRIPSNSKPKPFATPENAAYCLFTSGTTGKPKGTIIPHQAFCTSAAAFTRRMNINATSRTFQFASYTFDASCIEILSALTVGATICVPSEEERMNNPAGAIRRLKATWSLLTPSVLGTIEPDRVTCLKTIVSGGEALPGPIMKKWGTSICFINAYGPTECAVVAATCYKSTLDHKLLETEPGTIGTGSGGRLWIVHPRNHDRLMPVGSVGELVIEGPTVARGYLNDEIKTAKAFIETPGWVGSLTTLNGEPVHTARMYKTGDLVRYNSDGSVSYIGRKDTQIKLNGQRIELGEIEFHVGQNLPDGVQSAVELVTPSNRGSTRALAVFFSSSRDTNISLAEGNQSVSAPLPEMDELLLPMNDEFRNMCKSAENGLAGAIPSYMIPSIFIPIAKMPWTSAGKLDRNRLRNVVQNLSREAMAPYRLTSMMNKKQPLSGTEKKLHKAVCSILNLPPSAVGTDDSFIRLGGNSVLAMRLVAAAQSEGLDLSVIDIFTQPRLADLAAKCKSTKDSLEREKIYEPFELLQSNFEKDHAMQEISQQCGVAKDLILDAFPTSPLQEALFTLSLKQTGAYVAQHVFELSSSVDIRLLKTAWETTVKDIDILRTRIVQIQSGQLLQAILKEAPITWLHATSLTDVEIVATQIPKNTGDELIKYAIVETTQNRKHFVWTIHHSLYDGWSTALILQHVQRIYRQGRPEESQGSYAAFIRHLQHSDITASKQFWLSKLEDNAAYHFPQQPHSVAHVEPEGSTLDYTSAFTPEISFEVTTPNLIRAAWSLVLANYTGSDDIVFGETLTGRDISVADITKICGPTLTTVPTRVQLDRNSSVADFLKKISADALHRIPHQHFGLSEIKKLGNRIADACDFQNLLVIQTASEDIGEAMWSVHDGGAQGSFFTYPLVIECTMAQNHLQIQAHYHANVISKFEVQRLLYNFDSTLQQLNSAKKLSEINILSQHDKDLLRQWNNQDPVLVDETIPVLFFRQVKTNPHKVAVSAFDGEFTYAELHSLGSRVAQQLIEFGAGPEVLIPTCIDKSCWAVVAIIGVLISGAAYVPISPSHPVSRHHQIMADCDASIIVCSPQYENRFIGEVQNIVCVGAGSIVGFPQLQHDIMPRANSENTCYVIYTSGSTGTPKGVVVEHKAIASSSAAICRGLHMTPDSRVFQFCSFLFDVSIGEILTPLTCGATICMPSEEQRTTDVAAAITSLQADWAFLTPSVAALIEGMQAIPTLTTLVAGGEAMTTEVIDKFAAGLRLCNGYGPTEGTVFAVTNDRVSEQRSSSIIGYSLQSGRAWLTMPSDPQKLASIGSIAELCIEGPFLARGYLNAPEKTAATFIDDPAFMKEFTQKPQSRIYRTGDLVRYMSDGSIAYIGRRDNQVKLAGQRIELGEIEHHLQMDKTVVHAVVHLPKAGPVKDRLVATFSVSVPAIESMGGEGPWHEVLSTPEIKSRIEGARERLSDLVPPYMIPSMWIVVRKIPLLASAKVDRRQVAGWLEALDNTTYKNILEVDNSETAIATSTEALGKLQAIWSSVLNLPIDDVKPNRSWLSLGGDSITAMQLLAKCRAEGIQLNLNQVLRAKSLAHLARSVEPSLVLDYGQIQTDKLFDLSPIQQLYFQTEGNENSSRFNQSFTGCLTRPIELEKVKAACDAIVTCHSMLRARFQKNDNGNWQQLVLGTVDHSYALSTYHASQPLAAVQIIAETQKSLDIRKGPVFAVNLIHVQNSQTIIFIAAHHLVIDVVSWQIVLGDLENMLSSSSLPDLQPELPFQVWMQQQLAHAQEESQLNVMRRHDFKIHVANIEYWGLGNRANVYGDVERDDFTLDKSVSSKAISNHEALRTDVVDLFLASIAHSFSRVFINRATPTIFNESHGREVWQSSTLDLSRTVGWFTTVSPITVPISEHEDDVIHTVRQVKDSRRRIDENGRQYFAHRFLTDDGRQRFADHIPMEVIFNYLGKTQQQDSQKSLVRPIQLDDGEDAATSDVGKQTPRLALFEISASIIDGQIEMSFMYNRLMRNQKGIRRWIAECQRTLEEIVTTLSEIKTPLPTLADFPLLPLESYQRLGRVLETLPTAGISSYELVEDIYPCSAIQEGMLLSQIKDPDSYWSFVSFEVKGKQSVDVNKVADAWNCVVNRHQALRTVIVDSVCKGGVFDQIVLKNVDSGLARYTCTDTELNYKLECIRYRDLNGKKKPQLPHQAAIVHTNSGRVVVKVIVNHAVVDGGSLGIIGRDFQDAYENRLPDDEPPLYSDYIKYLRSLDDTTAIKYWKTKLHGVQPCYFPSVPQHTTKHRKLRSLNMSFRRFADLHVLAESSNVTLANILLATWALILRAYTGASDVCYGYLTSGRNVPVTNVENAVGAFINMLVSRTRLIPTSSLMEVIQKVQLDFMDSLPHQHCSLARFQHDLGLGGKPLFNTAVSIQSAGAALNREIHSPGIDFEQLEGHDPSEFAITVNIDATRGDEAVRFAYWTDVVSDEEARKVSALMTKILSQILSSTSQTVAELEHAVSERAISPATLVVPTPSTLSPRARPRPNSLRSTSSVQVPLIEMPPSTPPALNEAPDWSNLIRSIVSEMVPQIVDQMMARNSLAPPPAASTIDQMTNQMTGLINRRTSVSQAGRPNLETGSMRSRRMSVTSHAESRIQTAADMVAAAGVMATEASKSPEIVEKKLLGLWSELLDMVEDTIEQDDSFFQLGGDSIIAMRLVGAAREEGLSMTVADVFKNPTFADMARVVRVAGEVIDEVMSRAGGGSVHGKDNSGPSANNNQLSARAAALWDDFQSVISEYKGDGNSIHETAPQSEQVYQTKKDPSRRLSGLPISQPTVRPTAKRRSSSRSQILPRTIEEVAESNGNKSVSLLGDPNVDSVISKVQVFKGGIQDVLPVTDFQALAITGSLLESKWMLNYFFLEGDGPLDLRRLKQAAFRVVQAFDILRTVFVPYGDRFLQVVLRKLQPDFIYQQTDDDLDAFTTEIRQRDREHGPRLGEAFTQFVVVRQKQSGRYRIIMRLSHAQYDGVCIGKILGGLQSGYNGLPVSSAPSFGNFVRESAKAVAGAHDHWRETLRGSKMTEIVNRFGPNYQRSAGCTTTIERKLNVRPLTRLNITAASVVKAAWAATLARIASKADIIFGHVISGRNSEVKNIENIVGPCLNTVPVRVVYRPEWTVLDLLGYIQDQQIANMPYESLGFREITRHCTDWPDWTNFSSVLQHDQNIQSESPTLQLGGVDYSLGAAGTQQDFADFSINTTSYGGTRLDVALTYAPNSTITSESAQHTFEMLCANIISFSDDPHAMLPSPSELSSQSSTTINSDQLRKKPGKKAAVTLPSDTGLSMHEVNTIATTLRAAWQQILRDDNGTPLNVELGSDFFQLGGDIMGLAQAASVLAEEGFNVRVEDLLDKSTFVDQVSVLIAERKKQLEKDEQIQKSPWGDKGKMKRTETVKPGGKKTGLGALAKKIGLKKGTAKA